MVRTRRIDYAGTGIDFAKFITMVATTETDCGTTYPLDTDEDEIVIFNEGSGATTAFQYDLMYQLPANFSGFMNQSNDITLRAKQTGGGTDMVFTIELYDNAGANASDASISSNAMTGSWATYDCAVSNPDNDCVFRGGDHIILRLSGVGIHADDDGKFTFPKIKCYIYQNN